MNYVQFHIGDWVSGTRLLSPMEKGIYIDLLTYYYETEKPLMRSYFDRITRAYTEAEKKAFDYVIGEYFHEAADGFHNDRADAEIAKAAVKSEKARRSINARWSMVKGEKPVEKNGNSADTNEIREKYDRTTNEILTNNQEPIYISDKNTEENSRKKACPFDPDSSIPDDFLSVVDRLGLEDPQGQFASFVNHHAAKGSRFVNWKAAFRTWCMNAQKWAKEKNEQNKSIFSARPKADFSAKKNAQSAESAPWANEL